MWCPPNGESLSLTKLFTSAEQERTLKFEKNENTPRHRGVFNYSIELYFGFDELVKERTQGCQVALRQALGYVAVEPFTIQEETWC